MQTIIDSLQLTDAEANLRPYNRLMDAIIGKPGYVYYLQIYHKPTRKYIYKIGFTSYTPEHRIQDLLGIRYPRKNITITKIAAVKFPKAITALCYEQKLHQVCRQYNIASKDRIPGMLQNGMSELYNCDVLGLVNRTAVAPYLILPPKLDKPVVKPKPTVVKSAALVRSQLYCKCTREHLRISPAAHVESCPRYGIPLSIEAIAARQGG